VVDALGRTVTFPSLPRRIAVAGRSVTLIANALYLFPEARKRVVAIPSGSVQLSDRFLSLLDSGLSSKVLAGGSEVGPEQIAPYKPDVVVLKSVMASRLGEPLERLGVKVVYVDGESQERFTEDLSLLGRLLGNPERANVVIAYYRARTDRVAARLRGLPAKGRPRVLFLTVSTRGADQAFHVPPVDWLQHRMISAAGGVPVVDATLPGSRTVTLEQVAAWNPDQIYVAHYRGDSRDVVARLRADATWQALPAVKAGRLYAFPGDFYSWDQPDPRWILGQLWLAGKVHPELFPDLDMRAEILSFFRELYGLPAETVRTRIAPELTGDIRW
jgi:iron complex transport system substrate-binding protein